MNWGDDLTWTCHVCRDVRPDRFISVHKKAVTLAGGIVVGQNVRYCNDRQACILGAPNVDLLGNR